MCLRLKYNVGNLALTSAKEDIVCYKVLDKINHNRYRTPFMSVYVEIGKEYTSEITFGKEWNSVDRGLHTFKKKEDAEEYAKKLEHYIYCDVHEEGWEGMTVAECIIPMGCYYYEGYFDSPLFGKIYESYASDKIKYKEIIK